MLLIGCAAGAASFTHVHDVAAAHGQPGWLAWADAVVLELTSIAAGLELRRHRRLGTSAAFPATVLTLAVLLSLAAQVVEAEASVIGWIAAALPALGFLAMVKIALGRMDPTPHRTARPDRTGPRPTLVADMFVSDTSGMVRDRTAAVPAAADQGRTVPDRRDHTAVTGDDGPQVAALVPAARTAARALTAEGTPLSRKALAGQLRLTGISCQTPPPRRSCASCAPRPLHRHRPRRNCREWRPRDRTTSILCQTGPPLSDQLFRLPASPRPDRT
ncbi:DUF2637 domain-containing protein [Micromonospora sp. NPDC005087]|uniref:DUF2637 domain-containing protein n=1 Tax=Micromonospora sp. NPDC005087 TaxID=3364225 RepID=UPI0036A468A0